MTFDVLTLSAVLVLAGIIQAGILLLQYRNNPGYPGIGWWALGSICTASGFALNLFRASPVWLPVAVILGNSLFIFAQLFFYKGSQQFLGLRKKLPYLYAGSVLYFCSLIYYFYIEDQLAVRAILVSAIVFLYAMANALLLLRNRLRLKQEPQLLAAAAFGGLSLVFGARLIYLFLNQDSYGGYFSTSAFQFLMLFSVFAASNLWTFGFILMINHRLQRETGEMRERFEVLFHTSPDAALLTRMDDGMIVEVNEGFSSLFGYEAKEALGKTSLELKLWKQREDRRTVVELLLRNKACENLEFSFLHQAGYEWVGIYSAKIIYLEQVPYMISLIRDITLRKQEEEKIRQSDALHRSILSASPDGVVITDLEGTILMVSPKVVTMMGYDDESSLIGKNHLQFLLQADRNRAVENIELMFQGIFTGPAEYRVSGAAGRIVDVESNAEFVRDAVGQPQKIVFFVRDIRERKQIEAIMQRNSRVQMVLGKISEEALRDHSLTDFFAKVHQWVEKILPLDSFSIVIVDEMNGNIKIPYCMGEKVVLPSERRPGKGLTEYLLRHGHPLLLEPKDFQRLNQSGEIDLEYGNIVHQWLGAPLSDLQGKAFGIVALNLHQPEKRFQEEDTGILAIIAAQVSLAIGRKRLENELKRLAMTDELTGIANRRYFMSRIEEELRRIRRYPTSAVLVMMDIDHFKKVNDNFGHRMGDEVLRSISQVGRRFMRETDLIGRIGGEEFCLLLPETTLDQAIHVAERLRLEVAGMIFEAENGTTFSVTASFGVAGANLMGEFVSEWLNRADKALYKAKEDGRNRVELA